MRTKQNFFLLWLIILSCYMVFGCSITLLEIPLSGWNWAQPKQETKTDSTSTTFLLRDNVLSGVGYSENKNYHIQLNAAVILEGNARTVVLGAVFVHPFRLMSMQSTLLYIKSGKSLVISSDALDISLMAAYKPQPQIDTIKGTQPPLATAFHQAIYVVNEEIIEKISS